MTLPESSRLNLDARLKSVDRLGGAVFFASATLESHTRTNPWAVGTSTAVNGALIALLLIVGLHTTVSHLPPAIPLSPIHLSDFPLFAPATPQANDGGNGSGSHDLVDPTRGNRPKFTATPLAPPIVATILDPKLAEPDSVKQAVMLPSDPSLPTIGMPNSTNVTMISNGPGDGAGIGLGRNGQYGIGTGDRFGPGPGNGYLPGDGVKAPVLVFAPTPEFSDEARRNKYQGICMISVIVDDKGVPRNPVIIRRLGEGLDEKALEAIPQYRFKPGMKDGHAVATRIIIEVDFRLL